MFLKSSFRAAATVLLSLGLLTSIAAAQDHEHGYDKHDRDDHHDRDYDHGHGHAYGHDRDQWRHEEYREHDRDLRRWYHDHYHHLPPGLAKRDRLSPGQERFLVVHGILPVSMRPHMQPCPHEVEVMLPPPPPNHAHVFIGGNLVLVNRANFQIVDVFHFDLN